MPGAQPRRPPPPERARFTSRAAVLAVVVCAMAQSQATTAELARLRAEALRLGDPAYIEQQAQDRLHMCLPGANCYVIIGGQAAGRSSAGSVAASTPWYERLWHSVRQADQGPVHE